MVALVVALTSACSVPVQESAGPALETLKESIQVVAIVPFSVSQGLRDQPGRFGSGGPDRAASVVERQVADTLQERRVRVIPIDEVRLALEAAGGEMRPAQAARMVSSTFGADALPAGQITHWQEREGTASSASHGASVRFQIVLFDAPGAKRIWSGVFDETQRPLSENLLQSRRWAGGGTRWVTAEELARWGAEQTARQLPLM
jgi:hypothetical protein